MLGIKLFSTPPPTQKIPAQRELSTAPDTKDTLYPSITPHQWQGTSTKPGSQSLTTQNQFSSPQKASHHTLSLLSHQISILNFSLWKIWAQDFPFLLPAHFSRKCNLQSSQLPGLTSLALQKPHLFKDEPLCGISKIISLSLSLWERLWFLLIATFFASSD